LTSGLIHLISDSGLEFGEEEGEEEGEAGNGEDGEVNAGERGLCGSIKISDVEVS